MDRQDNEAEAMQYRPISRAALLALVLGLLSSLALLSPLLWPLPIVAMAVSFLALRHLSLNATEIIGRAAAITGLMAALFFGTWAPAHYFSRAAMLHDQAKIYIDECLEQILAGNLHEAHQFSLPSTFRQPNGASLDEYYKKNELARKQLERFMASEAIQEIMALGEGAKVNTSHKGIHYKQGLGWHVGRQYRIVSADNKTTLSINVLAIRKAVKSGVPTTWEIERFILPQ